MTIGERIKLKREEKKLMQSTLSDLMNVKSAQIISNWENNRNKPDADKIIRLCHILGCSADYLLGLDDAETDAVLSHEKKVYLEKYESLDDVGKDVVINTIDHQYDRCRRTFTLPNGSNGYTSLAKSAEDNAAFINRGEEGFDKMQGEIPALRALMKKSSLDTGFLCRYLHSVGFNGKVSVWDLHQMFTGRKVPSPALYQKIKEILEANVQSINN